MRQVIEGRRLNRFNKYGVALIVKFIKCNSVTILEVFLGKMEVRAGIEPTSKDLQSSA